MKNRWLLNLALVIAVGLLAMLAIFRPGTKTEPPGVPLTTLAVNDIQRIKLLRPQQPALVLEKSGEIWRLAAPRAARVNDFHVNEFLRLAGQRVKTRFPAAPAEFEKFGLATPFATIVLNDTEIRLGATHPLNNEIYVQTGDTIALVPATLQRPAGAAVEEWLSPSLLDDKTKIVAIRLPGFSLKQNEQGGWTRTPDLKDFSSDRAMRFINEWRFARALSVEAASGRGGRESISVTTLEDGKQRTTEFAVIARSPELILRRLDERLDYRFPSDLTERLLEMRPDEPEKPDPSANKKSGR